MADYDWFDNGPTEAEKKANGYRPLGFHAVWENHYRQNVKYYLCRRGCGTLVWNPEDHMKNVCTQFNPIAGKEEGCGQI